MISRSSAAPGLGQIQQLDPLVLARRLALDIGLGLQPLDHVAERRAVERDHRGQPRRVDAGMGVDRDQGGDIAPASGRSALHSSTKIATAICCIRRNR